MKREWKPGDVALVQNEYGVWNRAILQVRPGGNRWVYGVSWSEMTEDAPAAPMVVIDCGNVSQIEHLRSLLAAQPMTQNVSFDAMQAALRELADPAPRIEEPTGLGAVVDADLQWDDGKGFGPAKWASSEDGSWVCLTDGHVGTRVPWPALVNVRVLSEGVKAGESE